MRTLSTVAAAALALMTAAASARDLKPPSPAAALDSAALIATHYRVDPGIIYLSVGGWNGKLDVYVPRRPEGVLPTAVVFHGGGWVTGSRDEIALDVLPYLAMGFAVVNVDYRLARVATAPAAVQDSRCALRWVVRHAAQYGFDPAKLVLVGSSAGAHLALMAALAPASAGFDGLCPGNEPMTVAAVINFFGVVDVAELLAPPHPRDFAVGWMGPAPDAPARAARVSPLTYVAKGAPAVLTSARRRRSRRAVYAGDPAARGAGSRRRAQPAGSDPRRPSRRLRRLRGLARDTCRPRLPPEARPHHGPPVRSEAAAVTRRLTRRGPDIKTTACWRGRPPAPPASSAGSASARAAGSRRPAPASRRRSARTR